MPLSYTPPLSRAIFGNDDLINLVTSIFVQQYLLNVSYYRIQLDPPDEQVVNISWNPAPLLS